MYRCPTLSRTKRALLAAATVALSLVPAFAQQAAATLLVQVGQVSLLKDGNAVALFVGQGIAPNQVIVTGPGAYARFQVADGTQFEVFEKSQVTFREKGGNWKDLLNVWLGHVKVYVQHMLGPNPTNVTSPTAVISVRGTIFDVEVENEDGDTIVSVDDGAVQVKHKLFPNATPPILHPGDSIHVFHDQPLLARQVDKSGVMQKMYAAVRKALYDYATMHPGGTGGGSPLPGGTTTGGSQGDRKKNGGGGAGNPGGGAPLPPGGN